VLNGSLIFELSYNLWFRVYEIIQNQFFSLKHQNTITHFWVSEIIQGTGGFLQWTGKKKHFRIGSLKDPLFL
jgi:hypothetical protein